MSGPSAAISLVGMLVLLMGIAIPLAISIALIIKSRGNGLGYPACGSCKYDVSASVGKTDRCPECGLLFVTAGILPPHGRRQPALMWMGISLLLLTITCAGTAMFSAMLSQRAAARARAAVQAIQQGQSQSQPQSQQDATTPEASPSEAEPGDDGGSTPPPESPLPASE